MKKIKIDSEDITYLLLSLFPFLGIGVAIVRMFMVEESYYSECWNCNRTTTEYWTTPDRRGWVVGWLGLVLSMSSGYLVVM